MSKRFFVVVFCLFFFASLALGQRSDNRTAQPQTRALDRAESDRTRSTIASLPGDISQISGGGLVVEPEANGANRQVWIVNTQSSAFLFQGKTCNGKDVELGETYWEVFQPNSPNGTVSTGSILLFDSAAHSAAVPLASQVCSIEAFRNIDGRIQKSAVDLYSPPDPSGIQVLGEGVNENGQYQLVTSFIPSGDNVVILGRSAVAIGIRWEFYGVVVTFPPAWLPPTGLTTLTICSRGRCTSTPYNRKVQVPMPPDSGGKG